MGGCLSNVDNRDQRELSRRIEDQLLAEKKAVAEEIRVLLLGAGMSGKSTFSKQLKIINNIELSKDSSFFVPLIVAQVMSNLVDILCLKKRFVSKGNSKSFFDGFCSEENKATAHWLAGLKEDEYFSKVTVQYGAKIVKLWEDEETQRRFGKACDTFFEDTLSFFITKFEEILSPGYVITDEDVIRTRIPTTGVHECRFTMDETTFRIVDVGGQRSERKKWLHQFENVDMILFFVNLNEYNLCLYEDGKTNRMIESLSIFDEICNHKSLTDVPILIFLNKRDLFEKKIKNHSLNDSCFPDFSGDHTNFTDISEYIKEQFFKRIRDPNRKVYSLFLCSTNTFHVAAVFETVRSLVCKYRTEKKFQSSSLASAAASSSSAIPNNREKSHHGFVWAGERARTGSFASHGDYRLNHI